MHGTLGKQLFRSRLYCSVENSKPLKTTYGEILLCGWQNGSGRKVWRPKLQFAEQSMMLWRRSSGSGLRMTRPMAVPINPAMTRKLGIG
jgi:hypothetical protein